MHKCSECRLRINEEELKAVNSVDEYFCPRCGHDMTPTNAPSDYEEAAEVMSAAERALLVAVAGIKPVTGAPESTESVDAEVSAQCAHVKNDGDVCGRSMPCRYKSHAVAA